MKLEKCAHGKENGRVGRARCSVLILWEQLEEVRSVLQATVKKGFGRQNPETTFEVYVEVAYPRTGGTLSDPEVQRQFPEDYSDQEVLQTLTKFCFPFYVDSLTVSQVGQNFTFVLTDIDSKQRFGFCRLSSGAKSCFCILSYLPWFEVFYKLLNILADYTAKGQENQWNELLETLHRLPIPDPGVSVHLSVHSYFTVPDTRELPSIPENRNLTEYFVAVDVNNMLHLYASMLYERRILIVCSKLSTLTACIHGSAAMLYPMFWQHVYIPVLPPHLLDYCCAPMPYLIGIHLSLMEKVRNMALDDVVILNVDTNTLETPFDDLQSLPNDVISSLKNRLKKVSTTTGDGVARAFLKAQAAFFGSYRDALKIEPEEPITFCEEAFVSHYRSGAMRQFLQNATQLQLFKQFIDGRLDLLNSGEGFSDVFEEEISMGEYAGSDKLYHQWLSTVRKGSGAILNTVKTKANPAMKTVYKFAKDHAKMGIKEVKNRLKQKDITENGCAPTMEEQLPKTVPSPLVEANHPKLREDRRPITVHFGQVRPPRPHVVKRPKSNITVEGRRTSVSSPEHLVKPLRHYAVFLSEDSSDDECQREEGPSSGFTESFFFSAPFEWPLPYRTLKESDSAEGDEAESPEQQMREPTGPAPAPPDRAASIDLLEDVFNSLDMEVPLQPLGQAKSLEDLRTPKDLREQPGTFDYQRLDLSRSDRSCGMPVALKLTHPYYKLWSLGQDDMAIPSKPPATSPEKPSVLLGKSLALPRMLPTQDSILNSGDKEEAPTPTPGSITIPRPQGRKTPELGIVPPPPAARSAKLQAASAALGDLSSERFQAERERRAPPSPAPFPGHLPSAAPQAPTELLQPLSLAPGAASTGSDALLALLDPLHTAWSGSALPPGPSAPNVATSFTPQFSFPPAGNLTPFPQPSLNPFVSSMPATLPAVPLVSTPARPFGAPPASLGPAFAPSLLLSNSGFCVPHRSQPNLSALSMPNLFGQMPMGAHTSPLQPLGPPMVAPSRIRTLPLARSSARAAEAKQGLALRLGDPPLLPPRPPQGLEPALQPSAPQEARDPFEELLRKTKQDVSPAQAPGSVEQLRKQWETFE
ncbi:DENN domain-containing protein 1A isoform X7 [Canis lupus familiaris]|uniref:DENN domain-containing protein 1A isoform X7 n=1 Tax=Canis lupus familiaris TaxID=9615 RepID=UPI0003AE0D7B|nr:DENN domain-containing protein 1A isoform X7 [Canis lupus familiaris]XP_025330870.1 DENN domain-containing protein 1A isoform X7 [Canis lupus dingo]XP_038405341.1 DENN domain-containing protein 1A isoform X7 [Canis lupus familiaris]XP_038534580.1 DENN domain-containing protein 1A isoform X7 [Canis lupus familiaris]|eukprot:XP_005625445.1 DENN domain-containing protein 1A isoform X9 [Canis lupus familiaris]